MAPSDTAAPLPPEQPQDPFAADVQAVLATQPGADLAVALAGGIRSPLVSAAARRISFSMVSCPILRSACLSARSSGDRSNYQDPRAHVSSPGVLAIVGYRSDS